MTSRTLMLEQLIRCATPEGMTTREFRVILEAASDEELREYWEKTIGIVEA